MNREKLFILDTTMRDGDQTALGRDMNSRDKLELGLQLQELGVDIIEAGFPANGRDEVKAVAQVAREVRRPIICGLARAVESDIDAAWEALQYARQSRIHVFISSSDMHLMHQMQKTREQVLQSAAHHVRYARRYCEDVQFSPMDATRTEPQYLYRLVEAVINAGATTVNIPDTVGYALTSEFRDLITGMRENVPSIDKARISIHCHNDQGLAVANSIAAIEAGARQVEGCINGIGERAGNAALEAVIMTVHNRGDRLGVYTGINTREVMKTSTLVTRITGLPVQPNWPIVGANAFAHESGIHQDAVLKHRQNFEIMDPRDIGRKGELEIVLGATSGRSAVKHEAWRRFGIELTAEQLVVVRNKIVAGSRDGTTGITDEEFLKMIQEVCNT